MALFAEDKVEQSGIFEQKDLDKLTPTIGDSIGFYFFSTETRTSDEYGEFIISEGLQLDLGASSIDAMIEGAVAINFIPRTVLENKFHEGAFNVGELYRLEKTVNRGDTIKGKKVRYYAWDLFKINADSEALKKLNKTVLDLQGKSSAVGSETEAKATKAAPKAAPKV